MTGLSSIADNATTTIRQIRVMHRAGLVEFNRPDRIMRARSMMQEWGPIATGVKMTAQRDPHRDAVIDTDGVLSYRELDRLSDGLADEWEGHGVDHDSVVAVLARDDRHLIAAFVAAAKLGSRLILMNTGFSARQLADVAARERVTAVCCGTTLESLLDELPTTTTRLPDATDVNTQIGPRARPAPACQGGFVLLTGGTTGTPKGAPRTVGSPFASAQFLDRVPLRRGQTMLLCAPLFHGTALSQFILGLNLGHTIVVHGRFDPSRAVRQIADHRCDIIVLVPTMLRRILALGAEELAHHDLSSLEIVFTAGAALPTTLGDAATEAFGPCIYNFYGCTETGTATIATPDDWALSPGTVGKPPVGIAVTLYDAKSGTAITEAGRTGVIHVGNSIAFNGYSGGGNKQIIDGLMSTGDLGHWDDHGNLFIDGRNDDMIVSGGENVFPGEVEDLLYAHPDIAEAAVYGVPDDDFGQRLSALVAPHDPSTAETLNAEQVRAYVKAHLARFKVPRDVTFVDELPRTATGKIDRAAVLAIHRRDPNTPLCW